MSESKVYVRRSTYRGSGALFREHSGLWVLADFEGPGCLDRLVVQPANTRTLAYVDRKLQRPYAMNTQLLFSSSLSVLVELPVKSFQWQARLFPPGFDPRHYLAPETSVRLVQTDRIDTCNDDSRRAHAVSAQNESEVLELEGKTHRSHLNRMSFDIAIDPQNEGVVLRRTYDRFHGRQRARVLVDGVPIGYWYAPIEDRKNRWAEDEFTIPVGFTAGKSKVRVEIDPTAGTPLWDVSEYLVFAVKDTSTVNSA